MNELPTVEQKKGEVAITETQTLFTDEAFREKVVDNNVLDEARQKNEAKKSIEVRIQDQLKPLIEKEALASLGLADVMEARKLGKKWGDALKSVSEITLETGNNKERLALSEARARLQASYSNRETETGKALVEAEARLDTAKDAVRGRINSLREELTTRSMDPSLIEAFESWGQSPDVTGSFGPNDSGFNAGLVHFYQYRGNQEKNGRYRNRNQDFSLDSFISYTESIQNLIKNHDPEVNKEVVSSFVLHDKSGQKRIFVLTKNGDLIVGFCRPQEDGFKIVSVVPGRKLEDVKKSVGEEMHPEAYTGKKRLNFLQGNVELMEGAL